MLRGGTGQCNRTHTFLLSSSPPPARVNAHTPDVSVCAWAVTELQHQQESAGRPGLQVLFGSAQRIRTLRFPIPVTEWEREAYGPNAGGVREESILSKDIF